MSQEIFDSYLETIDRSATRKVDLTREDLLNIIDLGSDINNKEKLTDIRLGLLFSLIVKRMGEFSGPQLTRLMLQTSNLNVNPNKYYNNYFSIWENKINDNMIADQSHLYEILTIYVQYHEDFPEELVETWSRLASEQINEFSRNHLVEIMHIFAIKKVRPSAHFVEKWSAKIETFINDMKLDDLADVFYSCGKLNIIELKDTLSKVNHQKILSMNGQQLTKTLYGLIEAKITMENEEKLKSDCLQILKDNINTFSIHDLAKIAWCMGKNVQFQNDEKLWSDWEIATESKLSESSCNAQDLNLILNGLARINVGQRSFSKNLLKKWMERGIEVMDQFWPEMLPTMINELCKLDQRPSDIFISVWLKRIKESITEIFGRDLITVITSLADNHFMIKEYDNDFLSLWCDEAKHKSSFWSQSSKNKLKSSFELMNVDIDENLEQILKT